MADPLNDSVTDYWREFYLTDVTGISLCSLCGNMGIVDTRLTALSPTGQHAGRLNFCVCPNGQYQRAAHPPGYLPKLS